METWARLQRLFNMLRHAVRHRGLLALPGRLLTIWRREGWLGVRYRLRTIHTPHAFGQPPAREYRAWLKIHHELEPATLRRAEAGLLRPPRFCLLSPDPAALAAAAGFSYPNLEYRLIGASPAANSHWLPADSFQQAVQQSEAAWLILLLPGDRLHPAACYWLAREAASYPDALLLYGDEDCLDAQGQRCDPCFKPDWNPDLLLSRNYLGRGAAYRLSRLRALTWLEPAMQAAGGWRLALAVAAAAAPGQVRHLPRLLCHRHDRQEATAEEGAAVVAEHLARQGTAAQALADPDWPLCRVRYELPAERPLASLLIPTRNRVELLRLTVESLFTRTTYRPYELIVVDNGSDEPETLAYLAELAQRPQVRLLQDARPFNFAALNNAAARLARGQVLVLLNNDIEVLTPGWLEEMAGHALRPGVGAVGARLWYPNGGLQHGGVYLVGGVAGHAYSGIKRGDSGYCWRAVAAQNLSAVTAACLAVQSERYWAVGGLDEQLAVAFNDVDFCLRLLQAGYRNVWTPYAEMIHHESASRGVENTPAKRARFQQEIAFMQQRWGALLEHDPAYNPNLVHTRWDFGLAWPPRLPDGSC